LQHRLILTLDRAPVGTREFLGGWLRSFVIDVQHPVQGMT
jgi:hypothetical protein